MKKISIELGEGQRIWFTSDTHFGHRNVIKFCNRPFTDIKDMRNQLIAGWNEKVRPNDIVIHLGDLMWFDSSSEFCKIMGKLNGNKIYFVDGNHDNFEKLFRRVSEFPNLQKRLECVGQVAEFHIHTNKESNTAFKKNYYEVTASHYPLATWAHREKGAINLFGHIHSGPRVETVVDRDIMLHVGQQMDVGVDNCSYAPISLEGVLTYLSKQKESVENQTVWDRIFLRFKSR